MLLDVALYSYVPWSATCGSENDVFVSWVLLVQLKGLCLLVASLRLTYESLVIVEKAYTDFFPVVVARYFNWYFALSLLFYLSCYSTGALTYF